MPRISPRPLRNFLGSSLALTAMMSLTACVTVNVDLDETPDYEEASITVPVINTNRVDVGTAILIDAPDGIFMALSLTNMPAGWHGMHFHEKADCSSADFTSSGKHINPSGREHGLLNPAGPDNADLPNVYAHADGVIRAEVFSDRVSLNGRGGRPALLDADGSALVVHANPDDQITQPIGGAGGRIACGAIQQ